MTLRERGLPDLTMKEFMMLQAGSLAELMRKKSMKPLENSSEGSMAIIFSMGRESELEELMKPTFMMLQARESEGWTRIIHMMVQGSESAGRMG